MSREQQASSGALIDVLRDLLRSAERIVSALGASPGVVEAAEAETETETETGAAASAEPAAPSAAAAAPRKRTETVTLANGDQVEAEVRSEKTGGDRTRNYIMSGRKKIFVVRRGGQWKQRAKATRDFSSYVPSPQDAELVLALGRLNEQGQTPDFKAWGAALGKTHGELLGRYRTVKGGGLVEKSGDGYVLTQRGRDYVSSQKPAEKPAEKPAKGRGGRRPAAAKPAAAGTRGRGASKKK
jgi:hypothetical protein